MVLKGHWTISIMNFSFWLMNSVYHVKSYATANLQIQKEQFKNFVLEMKKSSIFVNHALCENDEANLYSFCCLRHMVIRAVILKQNVTIYIIYR